MQAIFLRKIDFLKKNLHFESFDAFVSILFLPYSFLSFVYLLSLDSSALEFAFSVFHVVSCPSLWDYHNPNKISEYLITIFPLKFMPKKWYYPGENSKNHFFLLLQKKWSRMGSKLFFLESKNHFSGLYKKIMIKNPLIASKKILQKKMVLSRNDLINFFNSIFWGQKSIFSKFFKLSGDVSYRVWTGLGVLS